METCQGRILRERSDCRLLARGSAPLLTRPDPDPRALHLADYARLGLGSFGRPEGFMRATGDPLARDSSSEVGVRALPELRSSWPSGCRRGAGDRPRAGLVHGDYRIDNVVLDRERPGSIVAVLDWEMATLGDPLADLGMLLMYWGRPGRAVAPRVHEITSAPGFLERAELVAEYAARRRLRPCRARLSTLRSRTSSSR